MDDLPQLSDYIDLPNWLRAFEEFLNDFSSWMDNASKRIKKCLEKDAEIGEDEVSVLFIKESHNDLVPYSWNSNCSNR